MAYTSIHAIKTTLNKAMDYIECPGKTDDERLITGYNVDPYVASVEMTLTRCQAEQYLGKYGTRQGTPHLAYHMIQSFSPQDHVTPEQAHELGQRLANDLLKGEYEYVIATHVDKGHIHNHIIFNATSFCTFKKFRTQPFKTVRLIRALSDQICAEAGLSVIKDPGLYQRKEKQQFAPSWRTEIRRRLNFVLEMADSYEDFVAGAGRLGVYVREDGKELAYIMEGQQKFTRAGSLDKDGGYDRDGLREQIEAKKEARTALKEAIREAAGRAHTRKEYQEELQKLGIKSRGSRDNGMFYTVDGISMNEWVLGPAYSIERVEQMMKDTTAPLESWEENSSLLSDLEERFAQRNRSRRTAEELPVELGGDRIVRMTASGILARVPDRAGEEQLIFIQRDQAVYHREKDTLTAYIGNTYDYTVTDESGTPGSRTLKGEDIIRGLDLKKGREPVVLELLGADVGAVGVKGLQLSIPEHGIQSLFLEDQFIEYDRANGGMAKAQIYQNWSYRYTGPDGQIKYILGKDLEELLRQRSQQGPGELLSRINAVRRKDQLAQTKRMADALLLARREGFTSLEDFTGRVAELQTLQEGLQSKMQGLRERAEAYRTVHKYLVAYHTYKPIQLELMSTPAYARKQYTMQHEGELAAWRHAEERLKHLDVPAEIDPDKVQELIRTQEQEITALRRQADELAKQAVELEQAREVLRESQQAQEQYSEQQREDRGR